MAVITVAAIVVAAGVTAAVLKKRAADKAAKAQKNAIKKQQKTVWGGLEPDAVNDYALKADKNRAKNRIALQEEIDPELAELRKLGRQQLLEKAQEAPETRASAQLTAQLVKEVKQPSAKLEALKEQILDRAQSELQAGAQLPPEFQAELVRSGLQTGSQAGIGADVRTIGGPQARLLGGAGIALQQQRQQEATRLAGVGQDIAVTRANLLSKIFPAVKEQELADLRTSQGFFLASEQALPEAGITGREAANLQVQRVLSKGKLQRQRGQVSAQQALAQGEMEASIAGSVAQGASIYGGAVGGGGVGSFGGAGGGAQKPSVYDTEASIRNFQNEVYGPRG